MTPAAVAEGNSRLIDDAVSDDVVSDSQVLAELERILASPLFVQSERLARFLRFTIEKTLAGEQDSLKEFLIGTQVYDRKPSYSPTQDSIVRTEARRLRQKLKEYYQGDGGENPVFIYYRPGSYVPVFRSRNTLDKRENIGNQASPSNEPGIPIAVIPFIPLSDHPFAATCALGISDELVHALMRTEGCRVIAASSVAQLMSQAPDIPSFAEKLGAQIIFDGTVQQVEDRVRINARIVKSDGSRLWSQRFDLRADPADLFDIQERVVAALMTRTAPRQTVIRRKESELSAAHLKAYTEVLAAEELLEEGTVPDLENALQAFRRIARSTPDYARAHCDIAQCLIWQSQRGAPNSRELIKEARQAVEQTLELDPDMIGAHSALACIEAIEWQWEKAEASFLRAIALGTHHAAFRQFGTFLASRNRFDEAWENHQKSQRLDPFSHRQKASIAQFFFISQRYEECLSYLVDAQRYGTIPNEARAYQALSLIQLGRHADALAIANELSRLPALQILMRVAAAKIFASCGELRRAKQLMTEITGSAAEPRISRFRQASLALAMNDSEKALALLEASFDQHESELPWIKVDPRFLPLQSEARFQRILAAIG